MTTSIVLRDTSDAEGSRYLDVSIKPNGDLVIKGQDLGPGVEAFFGFTEYEWVWSIAAEDCEKLRVALGMETNLLAALGERFSGDSAGDLQEFLELHDIHYEAWSRMGD